MKANYHTHTARCHHACGADEEYILAAVDAGFEVLGFSDHVPFPYRDFVSGVRMTMAEYDGYMASVRDIRDRWAGRVRVHIGFEAEYFPEFHDHLQWLLDHGAEYLIQGQHYAVNEILTPATIRECTTDDGIRTYAEAVVRGMRTGLFVYLAHPDLMMRWRRPEEFNAACMEAADMICQCALEMHMPLEYNLLGLRCEMAGDSRGYPCAPFWEHIRRWDNLIVLGSDAHDPRQMRDDSVWQEGRRRVLSMGFRLADRLPMDGEAIITDN